MDSTDSTLTDVRILIDNKELWSGDIPSAFLHLPQNKVQMDLGVGFHCIEVILPYEEKRQVKKFFYLWENDIVIDFLPKEERIEKSDLFMIELAYDYTFM